jgi:hypothetical protein
MDMCDWCSSTENITTINNMHACVDHIDTAMGVAFAPIKQFIRELS